MWVLLESRDEKCIRAFKTEWTIKEINDFLRLSLKDIRDWSISITVVTDDKKERKMSIPFEL